jgi:hypothetical protein
MADTLSNERCDAWNMLMSKHECLVFITQRTWAWNPGADRGSPRVRRHCLAIPRRADLGEGSPGKRVGQGRRVPGHGSLWASPHVAGLHLRG